MYNIGILTVGIYFHCKQGQSCSCCIRQGHMYNSEANYLHIILNKVNIKSYIQV